MNHHTPLVIHNRDPEMFARIHDRRRATGGRSISRIYNKIPDLVGFRDVDSAMNRKAPRPRHPSAWKLGMGALSREYFAHAKVVSAVRVSTLDISTILSKMLKWRISTVHTWEQKNEWGFIDEAGKAGHRCAGVVVSLSCSSGGCPTTTYRTCLLTIIIIIPCSSTRLS
jgi:hypothetical protein